jgi:hypothetical protein
MTDGKMFGGRMSTVQLTGENWIKVEPQCTASPTWIMLRVRDVADITFYAIDAPQDATAGDNDGFMARMPETPQNASQGPSVVSSDVDEVIERRKAGWTMAEIVKASPDRAARIIRAYINLTA